ncbi:hypothetical protein DPMN_085314 [Dreissena polymorpha]|uniref:Uncharacterized protein n=1 Tax=Dreissena polymorpha TaxID=45954 RepID=A0A9D3YGP2_DREPO|nr:hypothetical protein DPMN_085314 [Dreissena polymorpha]
MDADDFVFFIENFSDLKCFCQKNFCETFPRGKRVVNDVFCHSCRYQTCWYKGTHVEISGTSKWEMLVDGEHVFDKWR